MTNRIVSILVLCVSLYGYAMQQEAAAPLFSTFLGEQLTPESLPLLAPQMPREHFLKVLAWINASEKALRELVKFQKPILRIPFVMRRLGLGQEVPILAANLGQQQQTINQVLFQLGMPNKSRWNYIFDIPGTNYVAQIAGRLNRIHNLFSANNLPYETPDQSADKLIVNMPHTYQTVSRLATYLRAKEAVEKFNLDKVQLAPTYTIGLDKDLPEEVNDDNSIIIQEKSKQAYPVRGISLEDRTLAISPEAVRQVAIAIIYASMWDIDANLMVDPFSRNFVITDYEQPNNANPHDFFMKDNQRALNLGRGGIGQLHGLVKDIPSLDAVCKTFEQLTDDELKQIASGTLPARIAKRLQ